MAKGYYIATIQVLVAADSEGEACDAMAEAIRPILRDFCPESSWIDWRYAAYDPAGCNLPGATLPAEHDGTDFERAQTQIKWLPAYADVASQEGWLLSERSDGYYEIQRDDGAERWPSDAAAYEHVSKMARDHGSLLHQTALHLHDTKYPV